MATPTFQCPVCQTYMPRPLEGGKVACPGCGQKLRFNPAPAPAAARAPEPPPPPEAPRIVVTSGRAGRAAAAENFANVEEVFEEAPEVVSAGTRSSESFSFWDGQSPTSSQTVEARPRGKSLPSISLEDARAIWAGELRPDAKPDDSIRRELGFSSDASEIMESVSLFERHLVKAGDKSVQADVRMGEIIGKGGMGVVFAGQQASLNRGVAVKVMRAKKEGDGEARRKFVAEAVVTGALDHPNIVPVYDLGVTPDNTLFYTMKHVHGRRWSQLIAKNTESQNLDILIKVCEAVAYAHERGVIHRDIKPSNVMVGDYGEVLLMDWGLAVAFTDAAAGIAERLVDSIARGGTPAYMAPEMARGDTVNIGPASDVYLLGGVLYECVTGLRPHQGDSVIGCIHQAMMGHVQPTKRSGELVEIAMRALSPHAKDRFATAHEFLGVLRDYSSHRDSLEMTRASGELLTRGRDTGGYDELSRALFGYEEAVRLWRRNGTALRGAAKARLAYARRAMQRGDFDLARTLLEPITSQRLSLDRQNAERAERSFIVGRNRLWEPAALEADRMADEAAAARGARGRKLVLGRVAMVAAAALAVVVAVVASVGYNRVRKEEQKTIAQREEAERQASEAEAARLAAEEAKKEAEGALATAALAKKEAEDALKVAEAEKKEKQAALDKALAGHQAAELATAEKEALAQRVGELLEGVGGVDDFLESLKSAGDDRAVSLLARSISLAGDLIGQTDDVESLWRLLAAMSVGVNSPRESTTVARALRDLSRRAAAQGKQDTARKAILLAQRYARHGDDQQLAGEVLAAANTLAPGGGATGAGAGAGAGGLAGAGAAGGASGRASSSAVAVGGVDFTARPTQRAFAGVGKVGHTMESPNARSAELNTPVCPVAGPDGSIYFIDRGNFRVCRVTAQGGLETVAGNGIDEIGRDGHVAWDTGIGAPDSLAVNANGDVFIGTRNPPMVRRVDGRSGRIDTVLGQAGSAGDAAFRAPGGADAAAGGGRFAAMIDDVAQLRIGEPRAIVALDADNIAVLLAAPARYAPRFQAPTPPSQDGDEPPMSASPGRSGRNPQTGRANPRQRGGIVEVPGDANGESASPTVARSGSDTGERAFEDGRPEAVAQAVLRMNVRSGEGELLLAGDDIPGLLAVDREGRMWRTGRGLSVYDGIGFSAGYTLRRAANFEPEEMADIRGIARASDGGFVYVQASGERVLAVRRIPPESLRHAAEVEGAMPVGENNVLAESILVVPGDRREYPEAATFSPAPAAFEGIDPGTSLMCLDGDRLILADPAGHRLYTFSFEEITEEKREALVARDKAREDMHQKIAAANPGYNRRGQFHFEDGKVKVADLGHCGISNAGALKGEAIATLNLRGNMLVSLSGLENMPLIHLDFSDNRVDSLEPLKGMSLRTLFFDRNRVSDLGPLRGMRQLSRLRFRDNEVGSLEPLAGIRLAELSLYGNRIVDFTPLSRLGGRSMVSFLGAQDHLRREVDIKNARSVRLLGFETQREVD